MQAVLVLLILRCVTIGIGYKFGKFDKTGVGGSYSDKRGSTVQYDRNTRITEVMFVFGRLDMSKRGDSLGLRGNPQNLELKF